MTHYRSLSHTKWTCQYHVVFIPKYRKKVIYGELRRDLGEVLRTSCPRWAATNKRFERISGSRNRKSAIQLRRQAQLRLDPSSHL